MDVVISLERAGLHLTYPDESSTIETYRAGRTVAGQGRGDGGVVRAGPGRTACAGREYPIQQTPLSKSDVILHMWLRRKEGEDE